MGSKETFFEQEFSANNEPAPVYKGRLGKTRLESVLFTLPSGRITSVRVHTSVNSTSDPALADRLCSGTLNWVRISEEDELYPVPVPVIYHDEKMKIFLLMLPEAFRCRELEERACLLSKLAEDKNNSIPSYVHRFGVVFGHEELSRVVDYIKNPRVETTPVRPPLARYFTTREITTDTVPGPRILKSSQQFARSVPSPPPRSRKTDEKKFFSSEKMENQKSIQALTEGTTSPDARSLLQADAEAIFDDVENIEKWNTGGEKSFSEEPGQDTTTPVEILDEHDILATSSSQEPFEEISPPSEILDVEKAGAKIDFSIPVERDFSAQESESVADVPAADPEEKQPAESEEEIQEKSLSSAAEEESSFETPSDSVLPEALLHWETSTESHHFYKDGDIVCFAARLETAALEAFLGTDPLVRLQLHATPFYPLTVFAISSPDREGFEQFWPIDILDEKHLETLEFLGKDFRFHLDFYDSELNPVFRREIHVPLEENARVIRKEGMKIITNLGDKNPDFFKARELWEKNLKHESFMNHPDFDEKTFSKIASPKKAKEALEKLESWVEPDKQWNLIYVGSFPLLWLRKIKNQVVKASLENGIWPIPSLLDWALDKGFATSKKDLIRTCMANFTHVTRDSLKNDLTPEDELENWNMLIREGENKGVPLEKEGEMRLQEVAESIRKSQVESIETSNLKEKTGDVDESNSGEVDNPASVDKDLVAPETAEKRSMGSGINLNKDLLGDDQSKSFSVTDAVTGSSEKTESFENSLVGLRELSEEGLLDKLDDKNSRLSAAMVLCERGSRSALPSLFEAMRLMTRQEVLQIMPMMVGFGEAAESYYIEDLKSNKSFLRQGSALALGALRSGKAIDPLADCLLSEPTGIWKEIARVLGEIGPGAVMSLAARLKDVNAESRERIAWALAHIAAASSQTSPLEDLAQSKNAAAASTAKRALELVDEARKAAEDAQSPLHLDSESVVTSFSRRFLESLIDDERELTDADIIEEEDIVEQDDIIEETVPQPNDFD